MREWPLLRSMLFVPGDQPRMLAKAPRLDADAIILDVEDGGGVLVLDGRMVDAQIVAQAEQIFSRGRRGGPASRA